MNVSDVMTKSLRTCRTGESLVAAARVLWDNDCGAVPVVDDGGKPVGMVTDRDCCMAAYTRGLRLDEIPVGAAMAKVVYTVRADEPVQNALATMRNKQVRRLPVVDDKGRLCGIVSVADVLVRAGKSPAANGLLEVMTAIAQPRSAAPAATSPRGESAAVVVPKAPATQPATPSAPLAATSSKSSDSDAGKKKSGGKKK